MLVPFRKNLLPVPKYPGYKPYKILKRYRRLRWYKGAMKRYLNTRVQSRIVTIYPKEWNVALFMPMTRTFRGASKEKVFRDTWRKGRGAN